MPAKDVPIHSELLPRVVTQDGVAIREDTLYTNHKGKEKGSLRKRAEKTLEKLREVLPRLLKLDEAVLYLARAQLPTGLFEQWSLGWYIYEVTRSVLVLTNQRLLVFRMKSKTFRSPEWDRGVQMVFWGDIAEAKVKGWVFSRTLSLRYQNGRKETYWCLGGGDRKKLRLLLQVLLPASVGQTSAAQEMVPLCPNCLTGLAVGQEKCAQCQLAFKTVREVTVRSLLYPGGGYFYAGYSGLGVMDAIVESVLLGWVAFWIVISLGFHNPLTELLEQEETRGQALFFAGFFAVLLILERLVTIHHGRRFIRRMIPQYKPIKELRWRVLGLLCYATVVFFVWLPFAREMPLVRIAPDMAVYRAEFGTFAAAPGGGLTFASSSAVPRSPGQKYGLILRVHTARPRVKLRVEFASEGGQDAPWKVALPEETVNTEGGLLARYWEVDREDPPGPQSVTVYLNGTLVRKFVFTVR